MEKGKLKNNSLLKILAIILLMVFSCCFMVGCVGASSGSGSSSGSSSGGGSSSGSGSGTGSSGTGGSLNDKKNPYDGAMESSIKDYNDVFMGALAVYDVDNSAEVFYDNYTQNVVSFEFLINRQFETLANVIYDGLNYAYGTNGLIGNLSNYATSSIGYSSNCLTDETIYNQESAYVNTTGVLKYANSMNGGYKLEPQYKLVQVFDENGDPVLDGNGNPTYEEVLDSFKYISDFVTANRWNRVLSGPNDLIEDLKYIYLNTQDVSNPELSLGFGNGSLSNYYRGFSGSAVNTSEIDTIGFTAEYVWNVLYYIAYSIVGGANLERSMDSVGVVFNGTGLQNINENNYLNFQNYKGYERILIEIIDNAFKMVKSGNHVEVSDKYCYSGEDWNNTLYPILKRYEYVYYDDVDDIVDAEQEEYGDSDIGNIENWEPNFDEDLDFGSGEDIEDIEDLEESSVAMKVGSLRKIKEIILLPKINKVNYNFDSFSLGFISVAFARTSGSSEVLVNILSTVKANDDSSYLNADQVGFENGSYLIELPDGTIVSSDNTTNENFPVSKEGYLIVENEKKSDNTAIIESIHTEFSKTTSDAKKFKYGNVVFKSGVDLSQILEEYTYTVDSTSEEIKFKRLHVCNNLFSYDFKEDKYILNLEKNYMRFAFEYYDSNENLLDEIPSLYLMDFSFKE